MPRYKPKNIINRSQHNIFLIDPSHPTPVGLEYSNIDKTQEKYLKTVFIILCESIMKKNESVT